MQDVAHVDGLRPERPDHRRHVGRIVRDLVGELERVPVVPVDVEPDHLRDDREVAGIDRLLERELAARGAPA